MSTTDVNDFLNATGGDKHPGFKFSKIGDTCKGVIAEQPRVIEVPSLSKPGQTEKKLVIAIRTGEGDDSIFSVWAKGQMASAIKQAIVAANAPGLQVGGTLAVQYSEDRDTGKVQPLKVYRAQYKAPPAEPVKLDDFFDEQAASAPPATSAQPPVSAEPPKGLDAGDLF
jgi:hypothetical protein